MAEPRRCPALIAGLPTVRRSWCSTTAAAGGAGAASAAGRLVAATDAPRPDGRGALRPPLFVMFSSGTTGPPKAMVHGAGGTLLEHVKEHRLHGDLRAGDTLYFHTTTAWMMWNWQLSALAVGAHVVVNAGPSWGRAPSGSSSPSTGHRLRDQPRLPAALPGRAATGRPTRSTCPAPGGPVDRRGPARLAVRLGRRGRRGRCRCSRSPAAPTSSAASSSAPPSCPCDRAAARPAAWGWMSRPWTRTARGGRPGRRTRLPAALPLPAGRVPADPDGSPLPRRLLRRPPRHVDPRRPDRVRPGRVGAPARPFGRRAQRQRDPHRPERDLHRAPRPPRDRRRHGGRAA